MATMTPTENWKSKMLPDLGELDNSKIDKMLKDLREQRVCPCCKQQLGGDPQRLPFFRTALEVELPRLYPACVKMQDFLRRSGAISAPAEDIRLTLEAQRNLNEGAKHRAERAMEALLGKPSNEIAKEKIKEAAVTWRQVLATA